MRTILGAVCAAALVLSSSCTSDDPPEFEDSPVLTTEKGPNFEGDAELYRHNAQSYYEAGDYFRALDQFRRAIQKDPSSKAARSGEAYCLYNLGFNAAALGNVKDAGKRLRAAEEKFEALVAETELPDDTLTGDGFAWKSLLGLAMTQRALASLDGMVINGIDAQLAGASADERARMLEERKTRNIHSVELLEKALVNFRRLAAMKNAAPDAIRYLGDVELAVGNRDGAVRAYERYLDIARKSLDDWRKRRNAPELESEMPKERARIVAEIDGKYASAAEKTIEVLKRVAEVEFAAGAHVASLEHLLEAARLDPSRNDLNVPIAENHLALENPEEALVFIDAYIAGTGSFDDNTRRAYRLRSEILKELGR